MFALQRLSALARLFFIESAVALKSIIFEATCNRELPLGSAVAEHGIPKLMFMYIVGLNPWGVSHSLSDQVPSIHRHHIGNYLIKIDKCLKSLVY